MSIASVIGIVALAAPIAAFKIFCVVPFAAFVFGLKMLFNHIRWSVPMQLGTLAKSLGWGSWEEMVAAARELTVSWQKHTYQEPEGIVEGITRFARGTQNPVNWVVFRVGLHDQDGNLLDKLVGAMPESSDLRKGDLVKLVGTWTTGEIHRCTRVTNLSMRSTGSR